jgi:hypothetical protein
LKPPYYGFYRNINFKNTLKYLINKNNYDVIHYVWYPAIGIYLFHEYKNKVIISLQDSQSLIYKNLKTNNIINKAKYKILSYIYRLEEKRISKYANILHTVSKNDLNHLIKNSIKNTAYIPTHIPIAISKDNSSSYCGDYAVLRPNDLGIKLLNEKVIPKLIEQNSDVKISILVQNQFNVPFRKNIIFFPWVDDIHSFISKHRAVILTDLTGSGISTRALLCMSLKIPIIATPISMRGLNVIDRNEYLSFTDEEEFMNCLDILNNQTLISIVTNNAKKYVDNNFSFISVMNKFQKLYDEIENTNY